MLWDSPFPQDKWALTIPQQARIWLTSFLYAQALLRKQCLPAYSKMVSFFFFFLIFIVIQLQLYAFSPHPSTPPQLNPPPSPTSTHPLDFFFTPWPDAGGEPYLLSTLGTQSAARGRYHTVVPPPHESILPPSIFNPQFHLLLPCRRWFLGWFPPTSLRSCSHDVLHLFLCLANCGGRGLACDLPSHTHTGKAVDFSVCSAFYLLLGQNGIFQNLYLWDRKPEVLLLSDNNYLFAKSRILKSHFYPQNRL